MLLNDFCWCNRSFQQILHKWKPHFWEITVSMLEDQETFEGIDAGGTVIFCISGSSTAWVKFCPSFNIVSLGAFSTRPTCLRQVTHELFCAKAILSVWHFCFAISLDLNHLKNTVFIFNCQTCALAWCQFYDIIITVLIKQCNCNNACNGFEKGERKKPNWHPESSIKERWGVCI